MKTENITIGPEWEQIDGEIISNPTNTIYEWAIGPADTVTLKLGHPFLPYSGYKPVDFNEEPFWVRSLTGGMITVTKL